VPVKTEAIGKQWPATEFEVEADRIRQYASAIGEEHQIYHDAEAAKAAGFRDLVAPPMFAVVYSAAIIDPEVGINLPTMVHGGQDFEWGEPVCAGDVITTAATCKEIYEQDGKGFYVFESVSTNQDKAQTVEATWTNIVRGV
jgi:acyl dehydratase